MQCTVFTLNKYTNAMYSMLLYYFVSRKACGSRALELSSLGATPALGILSLVLEPAPAAEDIIVNFV